MATSSLILALALTLTPPADSLTNYVLCRSLRDQQVEQVFPNRCPSGWVFVKYV